MRISDTMIYQRATRDVARQRSSLFNLQQQSATGMKFQNIEADPVAAERVRMLREAKEASIHYEKNITRSRTKLETADTALEEGSNILIRAKEIALAMSNEVLAPDELAIGAQEIRSLYDSILNIANTEAGGEFIFAGYNTNTRPFEPDGTYTGDGNLRQVDVGPNTRITVGVSGENAFTAAGGLNVFLEMEAFIVALETGDQVGIKNAIDSMDSCLNQVLRVRTDAGLKLNRLDVSENVRQTLEDSLTKEESSVIDIDAVETFMRLNHTSRALQEAMAVAKKMTDNSLLSRI